MILLNQYSQIPRVNHFYFHYQLEGIIVSIMVLFSLKLAWNLLRNQLEALYPEHFTGEFSYPGEETLPFFPFHRCVSAVVHARTHVCFCTQNEIYVGKSGQNFNQVSNTLWIFLIQCFVIVLIYLKPQLLFNLASERSE